MLRFAFILFSFLPIALLQGAKVEVGTLPGLRFDVKTFYVEPGEAVELVLSNNDDMEHNLVITKPGTRSAVVQAALLLGGDGAKSGYVPKSSDVLWNTPVVASGSSFTLAFTAPSEQGEYPFVCTYPGHGFIMFGTMVVTQQTRPPEMNTVEMPMNGAMHSGHASHSERPVVTRGFMPDSGPASIAVKLPGGYSYCWDAGAVRFRYAWAGDYIEEVYRKPMILGGDVFYRENGDVPIRVGNNLGQSAENVEFKGYRLDGEGFPEFEYEVDGVHVRERLSVEDGTLVRRISIDSNQTASRAHFAVSESSVGAIDANVELIDNRYTFPENGVLELRMNGGKK